jgi:hypothetical protein
MIHRPTELDGSEGVVEAGVTSTGAFSIDDFLVLFFGGSSIEKDEDEDSNELLFELSASVSSSDDEDGGVTGLFFRFSFLVFFGAGSSELSSDLALDLATTGAPPT